MEEAGVLGVAGSAEVAVEGVQEFFLVDVGDAVRGVVVRWLDVWRVRRRKKRVF